MGQGRIVAGVIGLLLLAGCGEQGSARQVLGMERRSPDAFAISPQAPLAIPADLDAPLPAPQPGIRRPQDVAPTTQARAAIVGEGRTGAVATAAPSAAEQALFARTGASAADPAVRGVVNAEAAKDADAQHGSLDFLLFWRKDPAPGVVVNAKAEAERLRQNRTAGKPAVEGATPVEEDSGRLGAPREIE